MRINVARYGLEISIYTAWNLRRLLGSGHATLANDDEGSPEQGVSMTTMGKY